MSFNSDKHLESECKASFRRDFILLEQEADRLTTEAEKHEIGSPEWRAIIAEFVANDNKRSYIRNLFNEIG